MSDKRRFNFLPQYKMHVACEMGGERPAYQYVYFRDGSAYASDGHILAKVPLSEMAHFRDDEAEIPRLEGKSIHGAVFAKILKYDDVRVEDDWIVANDNGHEVAFSLFCGNVMPEAFEKVLNPTETRVPVKDIGINAKMLHELAKAMGIESTVKMRFTSANKAIFVESTDEVNMAEGVIMPVLIQQSLWEDEL